MLSVIQDYLKNRKQYVKIGDIDSILMDVLIGVPQGSVLGPLLFLIFINDISNSCAMSVALFADDAVFIAEDKSVKALEKKINLNAKHIFNWLTANKLTLNFSKTKYMLFHNLRDKGNLKRIKKFRLNINKYCIKQVSEFKYLGIIFDNQLKWQNHIEHLCIKLSKAAGMIYKLKNVAPKSVVKLVYYSIVDTHLRYGITTYGSARSSTLDRLNSIHDRIIKYMKNRNESISQGFFSLEILDIQSLYKYELIKLIFKMRNGVTPNAFKNFIHRTNHRFGTRSRNLGDYVLPHPNTERDKSSIKYQGAICWNSLPPHLKKCTNKIKFLQLLKSHLLFTQNELRM